MMSLMNGSLHFSSDFIGWYSTWKASLGDRSLMEALFVSSRIFLRFEPVVDLASRWMEFRRNFVAGMVWNSSIIFKNNEVHYLHLHSDGNINISFLRIRTDMLYMCFRSSFLTNLGNEFTKQILKIFPSSYFFPMRRIRFMIRVPSWSWSSSVWSKSYSRSRQQVFFYCSWIFTSQILKDSFSSAKTAQKRLALSSLMLISLCTCRRIYLVSTPPKYGR